MAKLAADVLAHFLCKILGKEGVLMMAMLHPAAILRDPRRKPDAFDDFLKLRDKINEVCEHTYE